MFCISSNNLYIYYQIYEILSINYLSQFLYFIFKYLRYIYSKNINICSSAYCKFLFPNYLLAIRTIVNSILAFIYTAWYKEKWGHTEAYQHWHTNSLTANFSTNNSSNFCVTETTFNWRWVSTSFCILWQCSCWFLNHNVGSSTNRNYNIWLDVF